MFSSNTNVSSVGALSFKALAATAGLVACTLLATSTGASAQAAQWQGFYVGANGGYGWGQSDWLTNTAIPLTLPAGSGLSHSVRGWLGGGHLGYNIALDRHWLVGVDAAFDRANIEGSGTYANTTTVGLLSSTDTLNVRTRISALSSVAARAGFAHEDWLFYGRLGFAWANVEATLDGTSTLRNFNPALVVPPVNFATNWSSKELHTGWTIGAGLDRKLNANWSIGMAYDYYDLRAATHLATLTRVGSNGQTVTTPTAIDVDPAIHVVTARLTYRFGQADRTRTPLK